MARRNPFQTEPAIIQHLNNTLYTILCVQLVTTATYFNAYFSNPLVHKLLLGQFLALTAWFFYFLRSIIQKRFIFVWSPYYIPAFGFVIWSFIRGYTAPNPGALQYFYVFFTIFSAFPLWVTCFREKQFRNLFMWAVFVAGGFVLIGALRQLFWDEPKFSWSFFPALTLTSGSYERQKLGSFLGHNNPSSAYIWISMLYAFLLWYQYRRHTNSFLFAIYLVLGGIMVFLGGSRGVALMIPPALILIGWGLLRRYKITFIKSEHPFIEWLKRRWLPLSASCLLIVVIATVILFKAPIAQKGIDNVLSRFKQSKEDLLSGTYPRVWLMSVLMAEDNPLTGVGFSSWPYAYPFYQEEWFTAHPNTSIGLPQLLPEGNGRYTERGHNDYLQAWAELGIPGLFFILWLIFIHFKTLRKLLKHPTGHIAGLVAFSATLGTMIRAIFGFPFHEAAASCLFVGNLGLVSYYMCQKEWEWQPKWLDKPWKETRGWALVLGIILFIALFHPVSRYIVGDYTQHLNARYKQNARFHRQQGNIDEAQKYEQWAYEAYQKALPYLSHDGETLYNLGIETYYRGLNANDPNLLHEAIQYFEASKENYSFYDQYAYIGKAYQALWEMDKNEEYLNKAINNFKRAVSIYPIYYNGWAQIAILLGKSGQTQKCIEFVSDTLLRFPGFVENELLKWAQKYHQRGDLVTAGMIYDLAATTRPRSLKVFTHVMNYYHSINRLDMAAYMLKGLAEYQEPQYFIQELTKTLLRHLQNYQLKDAHKLLADLANNEKLQSNAELWYYTGLMSWLTGRPNECLFCWSMAHQLGVPLEQLNPSFTLVWEFSRFPLHLP